MKLFFTRTINILLVAVVLLVYQLNAVARAGKIADYNTQKAEFDAAVQAANNASSGKTYADGTYTGSAMGFSGDITVKVTVTDNAISSVEITNSTDDKEYLDKAKILLDEIVKNQGTDGVDTITGATFSSQGIIDAFNAAVNGGQHGE